ncbi:hypothetical protein GTS_49310 [Gandjariella thermophila]|uniref:DUF2961 domain-containing protein n=1 Tax=Gandjariella thermophila TaxID=1931992 RepID=A0A4D4JF66_9PSEU|nr:hypothetical protein GTS_49310 [Gandjariella thermophila]
MLGVALAVLSSLLAGCPPGEPSAPAGDLPPPYLGLDAYLHFDKLPYLEIGDRVAGFSTADPGGSNRDGGNVLGTLPDGERVLFDQVGPGVVTFLRMQEDTGGPWHLSVDGGPDTVVHAGDLGQVRPAGGIAARFPYPLSMNVAESQGSTILAAPLPYAKSLRFTSSGANGNFYALYRRLAIDVPPPTASTAATDRVAALLAAAGRDPAPAGIPHREGTLTLGGAGVATPVTTIGGRQQIRALSLRAPAGAAATLGAARLRIYWDGEAAPSVDAPVKFLAGDGAGVYQPADRPLVRALPSAITPDGTDLRFSLYWPMPFTSGARIELVSAGGPVPVTWSVRYEPFTDPPNWVGEFHANYTDIPHPAPGEDMTFLDYRGSGKLVGTVVNFGAVGGTLEGDPHIYTDGSRTPQIAVTGTEEWGMGGDYWRGGHQTSLPLAGLPSATNNPFGSDVDGAAEYRFLVADAIPFTDRIVVNWEHGAVNDSAEHYRATMLWYGTPTPTAVRGDDLLPGAPDSAAAHAYRAPGSRDYPLTSAYEYTVRAAPVTGTVTETTGSSTFTMALPPGATGGFLRRTLNSCVPGQRANVSVDGAFAGTWYTPGGSANPGRCWRDDDFPLPASLLAGKRSITIRLDHVATGAPPNTAWTAAEYTLFGYRLPGR